MIDAIGTSLVWCAVQVTLFSIVAAVVYLAARRLGPQTGARAALGSLLVIGLLGLLALSSWPSWTPLMASSDADSAAPMADRSMVTKLPSSVAAIDDTDGQTTDEMVDAEIEPATAEGSPLPLFEWWTTFRDALRPTSDETAASPQPMTEPARGPVTESTGGSWNWPTVFTGMVLVFLAVGLLRTLIGLVAVGQHRRRSLPIVDPLLTEQVDLLRAELSCPRAVELRESAALPSAATIGWRRPMILLPECWRNWSLDERRVVLAHELAHVARGDFFTHLAAQLGLVLHFYHPLVHWLARRLRLEQELAADAAAAQVAGGRHTYLTTLAQLALVQPDIRVGWPAQTFLPTRGMFLRRIEMLRNKKNFSAGRPSTALRWVTMCVLAAAGLAVVGLRGAAEDVAPDSTIVANEEKPDTGNVTLEFGQVIERTVFDGGPKDELIDIDTGKLFSKREGRAGGGAEMKWMAKTGVDAWGEDRPSVKGLLGADMIAIPVRPDSGWNITPQRLQGKLQMGKPGTPVIMSGKGDELPATFWIQTREGRQGVLQITGFTKDPFGVNIRYKLLKLVGKLENGFGDRPTFRTVLEDDRSLESAGALLDLDTGKRFRENDIESAFGEQMAAIDLIWDGGGVAGLMTCPLREATIFPLPDAENFVDAAAEAVLRWNSVKKSNAKGMVARSDQGRFCAVRTNQGRLAIVEIIKHDRKQATIAWVLADVTEQPDGSVSVEPRQHLAHVPVERGEMRWTCAMHPKVQLARPGKCPICAMNLIAVDPAAGPRGSKAAPAKAEGQDQGTNAAKSKFNFAYVPEDTAWLISVRVAELAQDKRLKPLLKVLDDAGGIPGKLSYEDVEAMTVIWHRGMGLQANSFFERVILRTTPNVDLVTQHAALRILPGAQPEEVINGKQLFVSSLSDQPYRPAYYIADKHTLILGHRDRLSRLIRGEEKSLDANKVADLSVSALSGVQLIAYAQSPQLGEMFDREFRRPGQQIPPFITMVATLLEKAENGLLTARLDDRLEVSGVVACTSADDSEEIAETVEALATLARNLWGQQLKRVGARPEGVAEKIMIKLIVELLQNVQVKTDAKDARVRLSTSGDVEMASIALTPSVIGQAREAAYRTASINNLKQIAVGLVQRQAAKTHFPPAANYKGEGLQRKSGRIPHPHSWRVSILPFIGRADLYGAYNYDEPWDSEENKKILAKMPAIFRHPKDAPDSVNTSYFALTGPETIFSGEEGTKLKQITDGPSGTLLIVEAKRSVPWTKPDDIPYAADKPLPKFGGWFDGGFSAAFADGHVEFISAAANKNALRASITKAGGEGDEPPK